MPPFISPESVKELNEVMCVTKDNWTPMGRYKKASKAQAIRGVPD